MALKPRDALSIVLAIGAGYVLFRSIGGVEAIRRGAGKFWEGLTFDPAMLGPTVTLTPQARMSREEYIKRGYLIFNPQTGQYEISPAGEAYIQQQQAAQGMGRYERVINGKRVG